MSDLQDARDEVVEAPPAVPPLGPGDDDPRSQVRGTAGPATKPLGPGDDDPVCVDRGVAGEASPPPGPGDGPVAEFDMAAPPPPSPGGVDYGARRITVFAKKKPATVEPAPTEEPKTDSVTRRARRSTQEKD